MGVTLRDTWGLVLSCSGGSCIVAQVRLGGGLGVGVGAPVAEKCRLIFGCHPWYGPKTRKRCSWCGVRECVG